MQAIPNHPIVESDRELMMELYKKVNERVKKLPGSRITYVKMKIFLLPVIYLGFYLAALYGSAQPAVFYSMYILMGLTMVVIFLNIIHEAAHGNIFKKEKYNSLVYHIFDFMGANSFMWRKRHLLFHHRFPDINGWDTDVEQSDLVTILPHLPLKKHQRYQHIYVFFLYPLFMLNWLLVRDFRDFFSKNRIVRKQVEISRTEYVKLILFKLFFLFMMIIVPWWLGNASLVQALVGFLLMTVFGSIMAMFVLLTAHVNSDIYFPQLDENGNVPLSWLRHQMVTTNDINGDNWIIRNVLGNFNFHLSHHLFPGVSSAYAPEITEVIRDFSKEHNLPYRSMSLGNSLKKHYRLLKSIALNIYEMEM